MAEAGGQISAVPTQKIADGADASFIERALRGGADAPDDADRFGEQKAFGFRPPDNRKPARFIKVRRDLGEEFVVRQPD